MKTLVQTLSLILMSSVLYAQNLAGQWNGTLYIQGTQLRIVFHVNKIDNAYEATMDSPDQRVAGIKVDRLNFNHPDVKFEISNLGAVYEGTMSEKGITGKWVQSGTSLFLSLLKKEESVDKEK